MSVQRTLRSILLAGLALFAAAVQAQVRGEVHEVLNPEAARAEWRRVPVPNAYIVVWWTRMVPTSGQGNACMHGEIAKTDAQGVYTMEGPNRLELAGTRHFVNYQAWAPGLALVKEPYREPRPGANDISLSKAPQSAAERNSQLSAQMMAGCMTRAVTYEFEDPKNLRREYYLALLAEARALQGSGARTSAVAQLESLAGVPEPKLTVQPSSGGRGQQVIQTPPQ